MAIEFNPKLGFVVRCDVCREILRPKDEGELPGTHVIWTEAARGKNPTDFLVVHKRCDMRADRDKYRYWVPIADFLREIKQSVTHE